MNMFQVYELFLNLWTSLKSNNILIHKKWGVYFSVNEELVAILTVQHFVNDACQNSEWTLLKYRPTEHFVKNIGTLFSRKNKKWAWEKSKKNKIKKKKQKLKGDKS